MARWLAIANPHAGAFRFRGFRERWVPRIREHVAELVYTAEQGHATRIAREAQDFDGIVAIGGDGTVFEVLAGVAALGLPVALIPAGRGNCLALELGVGSVPRALRALTAGYPQAIDLLALTVRFADGRVADYRVASTIAVGYVADVVARTERFSRLGHAAYACAALCTRPRRLRVGLSDGAGSAPSARELSGVVINNTRFLANFHAFPQARLGDGLLDVLQLDAGWTRQTLHNLSVLTRGDFYNPGIFRQAPSVGVLLAAPGPLMVDGEMLSGVAELTVHCVPHAALIQHS